MYIRTSLSLVIISSAAALTNIRFHQAGTLHTTKMYIHVSLHFDLSTLHYGCDQLLNATSSLHFAYEPARVRLAHLRVQLANECGLLPPSARQKRQVIAAALAVGAVTGYFSNQWLHRHQHNYDRKEGVILLTIQRQMQEQVQERERLEKQLTKSLNGLQDENQLVQLDFSVTEFIHRIRHLRSALNTLYGQRLPRSLISDASLEDCIVQVQEKASQAGGKLPFNNVDQLLQLPTSLVEVNSGYILAILHIPVVDLSLTLFHFDHAYVFEKGNGTKEGFLSMGNKGKSSILAYRHEGQLFKELAADDLLPCLRMGHQHYFCPALTLERDLDTSCLASLFIGHLPSARKQCHVRHHHRDWAIFSSGDSVTMLLTQVSFPYQVVCSNYSVPKVSTGFATETLPEDGSCHIDSASFRYYPPAKPTRLRLEVRVPPWEMKAVIEPVKLSELADYRSKNNLAQSDIDIAEVLLARHHDNHQRNHFIALYILANVSSIFVFSVLTFLYYQYRRSIPIV
jgi:hypothetical protein